MRKAADTSHQSENRILRFTMKSQPQPELTPAC
jgi:hypothetical protein